MDEHPGVAAVRRGVGALVPLGLYPSVTRARERLALLRDVRARVEAVYGAAHASALSDALAAQECAVWTALCGIALSPAVPIYLATRSTAFAVSGAIGALLAPPSLEALSDMQRTLLSLSAPLPPSPDALLDRLHQAWARAIASEPSLLDQLPLHPVHELCASTLLSVAFAVKGLLPLLALLPQRARHVRVALVLRKIFALSCRLHSALGLTLPVEASVEPQRGMLSPEQQRALFFSLGQFAGELGTFALHAGADAGRTSEMCLRVSLLFLPASIHLLGVLDEHEMDHQLSQMFSSMREILVNARSVSTHALEPWLSWLNAHIHTAHSSDVCSLLLAIAIKSDRVPTLVSITRTLLRFNRPFTCPDWLLPLALDAESPQDAIMSSEIAQMWTKHLMTARNYRVSFQRQVDCHEVVRVEVVGDRAVCIEIRSCNQLLTAELDADILGLRVVKARSDRLVIIAIVNTHACYYFTLNLDAAPDVTAWHRLANPLTAHFLSHYVAQEHLDIPEFTLAAYESISASECYAALSFEELRWLEYDPACSLVTPLCARLFSSPLFVFGDSLVVVHALEPEAYALYREFDLISGVHVRDALVPNNQLSPMSPLAPTQSLPRLLSAVAGSCTVAPLIPIYHSISTHSCPLSSSPFDEDDVRSILVLLAELHGSVLSSHLVFMLLSLRVLGAVLAGACPLSASTRQSTVTLLFRIALASQSQVPKEPALSQLIRSEAAAVATLPLLYVRPDDLVSTVASLLPFRPDTIRCLLRAFAYRWSDISVLRTAAVLFSNHLPRTGRVCRILSTYADHVLDEMLTGKGALLQTALIRILLMFGDGKQRCHSGLLYAVSRCILRTVCSFILASIRGAHRFTDHPSSSLASDSWPKRRHSLPAPSPLCCAVPICAPQLLEWLPLLTTALEIMKLDAAPLAQLLVVCIDALETLVSSSRSPIRWADHVQSTLVALLGRISAFAFSPAPDISHIIKSPLRANGCREAPMHWERDFLRGIVAGDPQSSSGAFISWLEAFRPRNYTRVSSGLMAVERAAIVVALHHLGLVGEAMMISRGLVLHSISNPRSVFRNIMSFATGIKTWLHQRLHHFRAEGSSKDEEAFVCALRATLTENGAKLHSSSVLAKLDALLSLPSALGPKVRFGKRMRSQSAPSFSMRNILHTDPQFDASARLDVQVFRALHRKLHVVSERAWHSVRSATEAHKVAAERDRDARFRQDFEYWKNLGISQQPPEETRVNPAVAALFESVRHYLLAAQGADDIRSFLQNQNYIEERRLSLLKNTVDCLSSFKGNSLIGFLQHLLMKRVDHITEEELNASPMLSAVFQACRGRLSRLVLMPHPLPCLAVAALGATTAVTSLPVMHATSIPRVLFKILFDRDQHLTLRSYALGLLLRELQAASDNDVAYHIYELALVELESALIALDSSARVPNPCAVLLGCSSLRLSLRVLLAVASQVPVTQRLLNSLFRCIKLPNCWSVFDILSSIGPKLTVRHFQTQDKSRDNHTLLEWILLEVGRKSQPCLLRVDPPRAIPAVLNAASWLDHNRWVAKALSWVSSLAREPKWSSIINDTITSALQYLSTAISRKDFLFNCTLVHLALGALLLVSPEPSVSLGSHVKTSCVEGEIVHFDHRNIKLRDDGGHLHELPLHNLNIKHLIAYERSVALRDLSVPKNMVNVYHALCGKINCEYESADERTSSLHLRWTLLRSIARYIRNSTSLLPPLLVDFLRGEVASYLLDPDDGMAVGSNEMMHDEVVKPELSSLSSFALLAHFCLLSSALTWERFAERSNNNYVESGKTAPTPPFNGRRRTVKAVHSRGHRSPIPLIGSKFVIRRGADPLNPSGVAAIYLGETDPSTSSETYGHVCEAGVLFDHNEHLTFPVQSLDTHFHAASVMKLHSLDEILCGLVALERMEIFQLWVDRAILSPTDLSLREATTALELYICLSRRVLRSSDAPYSTAATLFETLRLLLSHCFQQFCDDRFFSESASAAVEKSLSFITIDCTNSLLEAISWLLRNFIESTPTFAPPCSKARRILFERLQSHPDVSVKLTLVRTLIWLLAGAKCSPRDVLLTQADLEWLAQEIAQRHEKTFLGDANHDFLEITLFQHMVELYWCADRLSRENTSYGTPPDQTWEILVPFDSLFAQAQTLYSQTRELSDSNGLLPLVRNEALLLLRQPFVASVTRADPRRTICIDGATSFLLVISPEYIRDIRVFDGSGSEVIAQPLMIMSGSLFSLEASRPASFSIVAYPRFSRKNSEQYLSSNLMLLGKLKVCEARIRRSSSLEAFLAAIASSCAPELFTTDISVARIKQRHGLSALMPDPLADLGDAFPYFLAVVLLLSLWSETAHQCLPFNRSPLYYRYCAPMHKFRQFVPTSVKRFIYSNIISKLEGSEFSHTVEVVRPSCEGTSSANKALEVAFRNHRLVLMQLYRQIHDLPAPMLRHGLRVRFVDEISHDAGGLLRECFALCADELFEGPFASLFARCSSGDGPQFFVPNPSVRHSIALDLFRLLGRIMAIAFVSGALIPLPFASLVWKYFVDEPTTRDDLRALDVYCAQCVDYLAEEDASLVQRNFELLSEERFTTVLSSGQVVELKPGGSCIPVTLKNRFEYAALVKKTRLGESEPQLRCMLEGFTSIVPSELLVTWDWQAFEAALCGLPLVTVESLRQSATYDGYSEEDLPVRFLWTALKEFSQPDITQFLKFVWGTHRVPVAFFQQSSPIALKIVKCAAYPGRLPTSHTCFFQLNLPEYDSTETTITRTSMILDFRDARDINKLNLLFKNTHHIVNSVPQQNLLHHALNVQSSWGHA